MFLTNKYATVKPANKTPIPPIPFTAPLVLARNNEFIPLPSMDGICISATDTSTLGKPEIVLDADCNESNESKLPNNPVTPSIPWKIARPIKPITPKRTMDFKAS